MLWLNRKKGESIVVGDGEIEIVVGGVVGDKVRLGILADREAFQITKGEVYLAKQANSGSVLLRLNKEELKK